jgi:hypothetical protein
MIRSRTRRGRLWLGFILLLPAFLLVQGGCSKPAPRGEDSPRVDRLEQIFQMAMIRKKGSQQLPKKIEDFKNAQQSYPLGYQALRGGECVFVWTTYANPPADPSAAVLAYEKGVPKDGGYVVMLDGKVKPMTADEFTASSTPKGP